MSESLTAKLRRQSLIEATITSIHVRGSLDVSVSEIARRAGVSSSLAHHYFGGKDQLVVATMRHLLRQLHARARAEAAKETTPRGKVSALIRASFSPSQFDDVTVSAWLVFYARAQEAAEPARLLRIYVRRLHSNLVYWLRPLTVERAQFVANGVGAMIDGLYLRCALGHGVSEEQHAVDMTEDYVDAQIWRAAASSWPSRLN